MAQSDPLGNDLPDHEAAPRQKRQAAKFAEFRQRLEYLTVSYRRAKDYFGDSRRFNESLHHLRKATNPRARRRQTSVRLAPELEAAIAIGIETSRSETCPDGQYSAPSTDLVGEVCERLASSLAPTRGRPKDAVLTYYVQALMVLCEWATHTPVTASPTTNSDYAPQMTSPGAKVIQMVFEDLEPSVPVTTLMNIIRQTRAKRSNEGKRFGDFFPFYGGSIDPETGFPIPGPGFRLEKFGLAHPIYCS